MLFVVAGADASGKSTVSRLLRDRLTGSGRLVRRRDKWDIFDHVQHPACRFLHGPLAELRNCTSAMPVPARTAFLFWTMYMTMRAELLASPEWTLVDSYWYKHAASELIYGAPPALVRELSAVLPTPEKVYLLDVSPEEAWRRKESSGFVDVVPYECGMAPVVSREAFISHQSKLRERLMGLAQDLGWSTLDGTRPPEELAEHVAKDLVQLHGSSFAP